MELDPLESTGQESGVPLPRCDRLVLATTHRGENDKAGQFLGLRAKAIEQPGTHRRTAADGGSRIEKGMRGIMVDGFGFERPHDTHFIGDRGQMRKDLRHFNT